MPVLELSSAGIYCPGGDFYVDPWGPVERAVITHGHSDHGRWGMKQYLSTPETAEILKVRLGGEISTQALPYGEALTMGGVKVSLHPAGHIAGSAQVRIEEKGEVWVVSGDYKIEPDRTCEPFELVRCHGFVTETTFGLPIYRWQGQDEVAGQVNSWWAENARDGRASVLFGYSLGKAQRLMSMLDPSIGKIVVHGAVATMNRVLQKTGLVLPRWELAMDLTKEDLPGCIVLAPPGAGGSPWIRRFGNASTAFASGWMAIRGIRRRRSVDRGFVLSDHVDWPSLVSTIDATGASEVWTTHGYAEPVARFLRDKGLDAKALATKFVGETTENDDSEEVASA